MMKMIKKDLLKQLLNGKIKTLSILNGYFPQGENRAHETKFPKKIKFYDDLKKHIKNSEKRRKHYSNGRF